jgi:hypothetical protein
MAYAGAKFTNAIFRGLNGEKGVVTPTFVKSPLFADQGIDFFSSNVELGVSPVLSDAAMPVSDFSYSPTASRRSTLSVSCQRRRRSSLKLAFLS